MKREAAEKNMQENLDMSNKFNQSITEKFNKERNDDKEFIKNTNELY